jgi:hypothetical protein
MNVFLRVVGISELVKERIEARMGIEVRTKESAGSSAA